MIQDICLELEDPEVEEMFELLNNPPVFERKRSILDSQITPEEQKQLQDNFRQKHWMGLRIRFEYLWRTLDASRKRPTYIIQEVINSK